MDKRKKYLIQKGFQAKMFTKFLLMIILAGLLTSILVIGTTSYIQKKDEAKLFYVTGNFGEDPKLIKGVDKVKIITPILVTAELITIGICLIFVLFYSHRIAGPVYKITKAMNKAKEGIFEEIVLRKKDEFKELADAFNSLMVKLKERKGNGRKVV